VVDIDEGIEVNANASRLRKSAKSLEWCGDQSVDGRWKGVGGR
jgi:hypothetical protein